MARNRYDDAFGVVLIKWQQGEPPHGGPYLCEVWRAETRLEHSEPTKPRINVTARLEVWIRVGSEWKLVGYGGALMPVTVGEVRRHAFLGGARSWFTTVTLDGWNS